MTAGRNLSQHSRTFIIFDSVFIYLFFTLEEAADDVTNRLSVWIDSVCGCVWADIALIKESVSFVVDTGSRSSGAVNAV